MFDLDDSVVCEFLHDAVSASTARDRVYCCLKKNRILTVVRMSIKRSVKYWFRGRFVF